MSSHFLSLIFSLGYVGLGLLVFAESGLFFGFFLPGDSVLFAAGLLAAQGTLNIWILVPLIVVCAIAGDQVGYWFGGHVGPALFTRPDSFLFKKKRLEETHAYFEKYGAITIVLARFIPAVRTFAPILAGVGGMRYSTFIRYNIIGGVLWGAGITLLGYYLGSIIPDVEKYVVPIIILIIMVSALPPFLHWWRNR
ncbi:MAG: rane-associated protein [Patescibacteria group bacterium]|nr:rane-associated protein [Patescibacteria group bacterium]